ncbi:MAG: serine/threonine-protein kinase [Bryobacteraceae bacterium]|nr:serine/threonine-protein kinase [Bryobacteraceae bacterium]
MVCSSCGSEIPQGKSFCADCGSRIIPASDAAPDMTVTVAAAVTGTIPASSQSRSTGRSRPSSLSDSTVDEGRFLPGTMLLDRYRITGLIGRGGMGGVYRATDLRLGQQVALKFLPSGASDQAIDRFRAEVRVARQISHRNVCRVYDIGEVDGTWFLSMEYIQGEDLSSLLRRIGRVPGDKALEMANQICAGLAAAHEKGVLHRDLKPSNLLVDGEGSVVIVDFGLAAAEEIRAGTPAYMAPEQLEGREVTVRSDIYALGLVFYELFSGHRALNANSMAELQEAHHSTPSGPSTFVRDIDPAVERVILQCLAPQPELRPQTVAAVAAALPGGDPLAAAMAAGETPSPAHGCGGRKGDRHHADSGADCYGADSGRHGRRVGWPRVDERNGCGGSRQVA